eukprot:Rhum_TRINITY_DN15119_c3_g1::Rhum_TRINITY_DN15119_c3_g1_i4::g.139479::m.139479
MQVRRGTSARERVVSRRCVARRIRERGRRAWRGDTTHRVQRLRLCLPCVRRQQQPRSLLIVGVSTRMPRTCEVRQSRGARRVKLDHFRGTHTKWCADRVFIGNVVQTSVEVPHQHVSLPLPPHRTKRLHHVHHERSNIENPSEHREDHGNQEEDNAIRHTPVAHVLVHERHSVQQQPHDHARVHGGHHVRDELRQEHVALHDHHEEHEEHEGEAHRLRDAHRPVAAPDRRHNRNRPQDRQLQRKILAADPPQVVVDVPHHSKAEHVHRCVRPALPLVPPQKVLPHLARRLHGHKRRLGGVARHPQHRDEAGTRGEAGPPDHDHQRASAGIEHDVERRLQRADEQQERNRAQHRRVPHQRRCLPPRRLLLRPARRPEPARLQDVHNQPKQHDERDADQDVRHHCAGHRDPVDPQPRRVQQPVQVLRVVLQPVALHSARDGGDAGGRRARSTNSRRGNRHNGHVVADNPQILLQLLRLHSHTLLRRQLRLQ